MLECTDYNNKSNSHRTMNGRGGHDQRAGPGPIPKRWLNCPRKALNLFANKFLAFKTPLDSKFDPQIPLSCRFTPSILLGSMKHRNWKLCLWIDLTNTERYYDRCEIEAADCKYVKVPCQGHDGAPSREQTDTFITLCRRFIQYHPTDIIGVHCTHGFNRTGFLLVAYMVENEDCSLEAALHHFAEIRPPGIYKQEYINELYRRYDDESDASLAPPLPSWCFEDEIHDDNGHDDDDNNSVVAVACGSRRSSSNSSNGGAAVFDGPDGDRALSTATSYQQQQQQQQKRKNNTGNHSRRHKKGEASSDNAIFMQGVPGVETVTDAKDIDRIHRRMMELCGVNHRSFPGSQPVSMDKTNIHFLSEHPYRVSWKADGTRYMMLIAGPEEIYFIDRNNSLFITRKIRFFHRKSGHPLCNTLVDGEMVIDRMDGNVEIPRYLIYDIVIFEGNPIGKLEFYPQRLTAIDVEIIQPRIEAMKEGRLIKDMEPFSVRAKSFYDIVQSEYLLSDKFARKLTHDPDGLVFQPSRHPYTFGKTEHVLKWKPLSMNSVDFLLQVVPETRIGYASPYVGNLMVNNKKTLVKFSEIHCTKAIRALNGRIIECKYDNNQWVLMRERTDKSFPNAYETACSVFNSIRDPITKEHLLHYIKRYAWKDPMPPPLFPPPPRRPDRRAYNAA